MVETWPRSRAEYDKACRVIPGGVNSPARAFRAVGGHPLFIEHAEGPFLFDIEGDRYIDYVGSWGPMILGHRHPRVVAAVREQLDLGMSYGAPTRLETELAERVVRAVPSIEMVRMVNSGTEAAMSVLRLARGVTGRDLVIKFAGCYHGHVDALLAHAGSGVLTLGIPDSPGVPDAMTHDTLILKYNDLAQVESAFDKRGGDIAAVVLEPVVGNMGLVPPEPGFLEGLREITKRHGSLLIFDEVMTGFRLAYGGAQELYGVTPDLTMLGKIIGGGMPVGAYGGRAEVMSHVAPAGPVYQAGTLSGNPLAMASGLATLKVLEETRPYDRLERLSAMLAQGLSDAARQAGVPHSLARVGSMMTLFFNSDRVTDYDVARQSDTDRFARFFWKMIEQGIYLPCSQFEALFVSTAHTEEIVQETIAAARVALAAC